MAHYAFLDEENTVISVIAGPDENDANIDWEQHYSQHTGLKCKRTSYWTYGGTHFTELGEPSEDQSKSFRKNYAGIGFLYDEARDAFIPPQPYASWVLNETTCLWEAPVPRPDPTYIWYDVVENWVSP